MFKIKQLFTAGHASYCHICFFFQLKGNVSYQTALPPNEIVFKGVADFLKDKDLTDLDALAAEVFKESGYDLNEAASKLKESVEHFNALLEKRDYSVCKIFCLDLSLIFACSILF